MAHNLESELLKSKLEDFNYFTIDWLVRSLTRSLHKFELDFIAKSGSVISISNRDNDFISQFNPKSVVIYPFFTYQPVIPARSAVEDLCVGFIGGADWLANREAVNEIFQNILPRISRKYKLYLAGNGWAEYLKEAGFDQSLIRKTTILGYVDDISSFWSAIDIFLAPIKIGSGTNIKVCEAIYNGVPVYGFQHAFRGLSDEVLENADLFIGGPHELAHRLNIYSVESRTLLASKYFTRDAAIQGIYSCLNDCCENNGN